jgi:hypothetical protein
MTTTAYYRTAPDGVILCEQHLQEYTEWLRNPPSRHGPASQWALRIVGVCTAHDDCQADPVMGRACHIAQELAAVADRLNATEVNAWNAAVRVVGQTHLAVMTLALACTFCSTLRVEGNSCHNDNCVMPLFPLWPAVYCSNECAMRDA